MFWFRGEPMICVSTVWSICSSQNPPINNSNKEIKPCALNYFARVIELHVSYTWSVVMLCLANTSMKLGSVDVPGIRFFCSPWGGGSEINMAARLKWCRKRPVDRTFWLEKGESAMLTKFAQEWMHAHANSWLQRARRPQGTDQCSDCKGISFR